MKSLKTTLLYLFLIAASLSLSSCGKDEEPKPEEKKAAVTATIKIGSATPYHFEYTPVGTEGAYVNGPNQEGLYKLTLISVEVSPSKSITITGYIKKGKGTYHGIPHTDEAAKNGFIAMMLKWKDESGGQGVYYDFPIAEDATIGDATLTITSLTEDRIKGTFSGTLYTTTGEKAVIEDGKFDLDVSQLFKQ